MEGLDARVAGKGPGARRGFVQDATEREDIRPMVDGRPTDLFRRHVADGTYDGVSRVSGADAVVRTESCSGLSSTNLARRSRAPS